MNQVSRVQNLASLLIVEVSAALFISLQRVTTCVGMLEVGK
jgi:hypothetical protein